MNLVEYFLVDKSEEKECTIYHVILLLFLLNNKRKKKALNNTPITFQDFTTPNTKAQNTRRKNVQKERKGKKT